MANGFLILRAVVCVLANLTTNELLRAPHFGCAAERSPTASCSFNVCK